LWHDEACLSIPGLRIAIMRPEVILLQGFDLEGNEITIEADDFMGRMFQHEVDHLDGVLMVERLDDDMRKQALKILRDRAMGLDTTALEAKLVSTGAERSL
jgi:peptide deformylase